MSNPFDYVNAVSYTKKNMMRATENDALAEKKYNAFLTNRSLSYHIDCVELANEMNIRHQTDNKLQFEFLLNTIRPKKRYAKWSKKDKDGDIEVVKEYYGYSEVKARQAISILSPENLEKIRRIIHKGGRDDRNNG